MNRKIPAAALYPGLFLLAAALWLGPITLAPSGFPFWTGGQYSDLLITHWPNAVFLRRSLLEWRQVPLWNPLILSGAPFAADPLSGLLYPPNWLAVLIPSALAFNLLFWLHLAWAGLGGMRLAQDYGAGKEGALLTGLLWCGAPKLIGHIGLGHLGLVEAVCWTPWVLLSARVAMARQASRADGAVRQSALSGLLLGVGFLADPRWGLPMGLLLAGVMLSGAFQSPRIRLRVWRPAVVSAAFAAATCAVLALPLLEFLPLTTRADLAGAERTAFSLPPARLLGLLVADLGGWPEWMTYGTLSALLLGLMAIVRRAPGRWFWSAVLLVSVVLALGSSTPVYPALAGLPGLSALRVPARFLFLASLALAMLAGLGLDSILTEGERRAPRAGRLVAVAFGAGMLAFGVSGAKLVGDQAEAWWMAAVLGSAVALLAWLTIGQAVSRRWLAAAWVVLVAGELAWMDWSLVEMRAAQDALSGMEVGREIQRLQDLPGERTFSPSYSIPQQTAASLRLELAEGVNPLQLASTVEMLEDAAGFTWSGYSVTVPPFSEGDPTENWEAHLSAAKLGMLSVGTVVSAYPLTADDLSLEAVVDGVYVYRNRQVRPRAWVQEGAAAGTDARWQAVVRWSWSPNRIAVQADGPGTLVLSEIAYPGWQAAIDGHRAELQTAEGALRAVELPQGRHEVMLSFRPWTVFVGLAVTLLAFLALGIVWRWK